MKCDFRTESGREPSTMKLRTVGVWCCLCVLCTFALSQEIDGESQVAWTPSGLSSSQKPTELPNANVPRDKRALGLILSGLAQVFGYTVSPVQIAALPNPTSESDEARVGQTPGNGSQTSQTIPSANATQSNVSTTTVGPRQRETIRFTGVVNFGNGTGLLTQLQQYENIFHGGNTSSSSMTPQPPSTSSSMQPPQMDPRTPTSNQPPIPPLLVRIPLPTISEPPLSTIPQPPLPEIPPQDIQLAYPEPYIPVRVQQQMVYRRNESTEKLTVENKNISDGKDVQSPPPPTILAPYNTQEPHWKKEYEDRLAELERRQEEQAQRLREQEWYKNRQKENSREGDQKQYDDPVKLMEHEDQNPGCRGEHQGNGKGRQSSEEEEEQSRERYEDEETIREHASKERTKEPEGSEEEDEEGYRNQKNQDGYKYKEYEDAPPSSENYTSAQYSEPLPLSEDDEQRRPEELRNSYGEPLYNRELFDDGFLNYFGKFGQPLSDFYSSSVPTASKEESSKGSQEDLRGGHEDEDGSREKTKEEQDVPARNKYEEYSLEEEDTGDKRKDGKQSNEDSSEPSSNHSNDVSPNDDDGSHFEGRETAEELDYSKHMPLIVPVRYLSAPEELKETKSRFPASEKSDRDDDVSKIEATKKVSSKNGRRPKKEDLIPTASFPERPRKLHEGEQKDMQIWPPPFDFVLDSTIHANVVPARSNYSDNIQLSNIRRKQPSSGKTKGRGQQQRGRRLTTINSTQKPYNYAKDTSYGDLKQGFRYGTVPGKQSMFNEALNSKRLNGTDLRFEELKFNHNNEGKEVPNFLDRYKYTSNNNFRAAKRPNIEIQHFLGEIPSSLRLKKFEPSKIMATKIEPALANYYSELYPAEVKRFINVKNHGIQGIRQTSKPTTVYDPRNGYNFFGFNKNVYGLDYGTGNGRMFEGDKKLGDEEAIDLTVPQQNVYRYDESLTKSTSEPESKSEKAGGRDYANGATTMKVMEQERITSNEPITYINYPRLL